MDDPNPIDTAAPWTIKSVSTATRNAVTNAARKEGLTVGQWLERRVAEWEGEGSPVSVSGHALPPINLGDLAQAMEAARALANQAKVPMPPQLAKDALGMIRLAIRQAKGLAPPRRKPAGTQVATQAQSDTTHARTDSNGVRPSAPHDLPSSSQIVIVRNDPDSDLANTAGILPES